MKLVIDCEYNEDQLISMALVPQSGVEPFYEVVAHTNYTNPWVAENVIPILHKEAVSKAVFTERLTTYLNQFSYIYLIADWPEDIAFFCRALITGPGERINTPPLTLTIRRDLDAAVSAIPHNALADAEGIADYLWGSSTCDSNGISLRRVLMYLAKVCSDPRPSNMFDPTTGHFNYSWVCDDGDDVKIVVSVASLEVRNIFKAQGDEVDFRVIAKRCLLVE